MTRTVRVAIDIGGTFTDATLIDERSGAASIAKVLFVVFLVLFLVSLLTGWSRRPIV